MWNIIAFGNIRIGARVGHVYLMLFVSIFLIVLFTVSGEIWAKVLK